MADNDVGGKFGRSGFVMVFLDRQLCQNAVRKFIKDDNLSSTDGQLYVHHILRLCGTVIQKADAIELRRVANTSTAIDRKDVSFVYIMEALVFNAGTFALQYRVNFFRSL